MVSNSWHTIPGTTEAGFKGKKKRANLFVYNLTAGERSGEGKKNKKSHRIKWGWTVVQQKEPALVWCGSIFARSALYKAGNAQQQLTPWNQNSQLAAACLAPIDTCFLNYYYFFLKRFLISENPSRSLFTFWVTPQVFGLFILQPPRSVFDRRRCVSAQAAYHVGKHCIIKWSLQGERLCWI